MAKALLGHVGGGNDYLTLVANLRRLQLRVKELEAELEAARAAQVLQASVDSDLLALSEPEPAYS